MMTMPDPPAEPELFVNPEPPPPPPVFANPVVKNVVAPPDVLSPPFTPPATPNATRVP
jgi:hypothetical protein